ncbi:MAG TPA: YbhN family protein [Gaiellaceae bacterium]|nr:YbhN family protein [Gaiellaceae bacterium]HVV58385.1 YbhN family protein [Gaiellaceae bacterium]
MTNDEAKPKSLIQVWLDESAHPILALAVSLVLEVGAAAGLVYWVGWPRIWHALAVENAEWFALCACGQLVAYVGYTLALKAVARVDRGVSLDLPLSFMIVSIGFAPIFTANAGGGFSIDRVTLREAGMTPRGALCRVLALSALEYAVLAPAVAVVGVLLVLGIGGKVEPDIALPWLAVVPGVLAAAWITSPRNQDWADVSAGDGRIRRGFGHAVASLTILRELLLDPFRYGYAFVGAALYWTGDLLTLWAALRVFDVRLSVPVLVLAYGTGWALTRRSLPLGGPGVVEILLAWVLTWFHVPFAAAASGVIAYRLFNLWLALLPAAAVLPFARRFQRRLAQAATTPG